MKNALALLAALSLPLVVCAAAPEVAIGTDAAVRLDGDNARLQFVLFESPNGRVFETLNEQALKVGADLGVAYRFVKNGRKVLGTGRAVLKKDAKRAKVVHDFTSHLDVSYAAFGFVLKLQTGLFAGAMWKADAAEGIFPKTPEHTQCAEGTAKDFTFTFPNKRAWTVSFAKPVRFVMLDTRRSYRDEFEVRFLVQENAHFPVGKGAQFVCTVASAAGEVQCKARDFHGVWEGERWVKLAEAGGIRPGTALDLSHAPNRHAPAGVDGWLTATTNGQFAFARRAESVRFFGCALRLDQQLMDKKAGVDFAKDLARRGYDSVRLRAGDDRLLKSGAKGKLQVDPELAAQVDQLVASVKREGLYVMDDLLGQRTWTWNELGLVAPGGEPPSPRLANALFLGDARTANAWEAAVRELYGRKNKVSGKPYPDDPAMPFLVPSSDAGVFALWEELRKLPDVRRGYGEWLAAERKKDPSFLNGETCEADDLPVMPLHEKKAKAIRRFLAETENGGLCRQKRFLRSLKTLKSKALVGAAFGSFSYPDVASARVEGADFVCGSFYLDPPRNLGEKWTMPCRIDNVNPLVRRSPVADVLKVHAAKGKPLCITSWSAAGESSWRCVSGLFVGASAAKEGLDGLWRDTVPTGPLEAATDRAIWSLYARGDLRADDPADAFVLKGGALTVKTARTAGGFSPKPDGRIVAPPVAVTLEGSRAAVWATSLTEAPIESSKRILVTHLTDMQKAGTLFADSRCDLVMRLGTGATVVRAGKAQIELALPKALSYRVYALSSDGARLGRVEAESKDGLLTFTADVRGVKSAQYLYEVVRE